MDMIDSKHLRLIVAIDQFGSLTKAAKELHLTQSALSHQLKQLEEHLGVEVFHRMGNQLYFTEAGKEFKDQASQILEAFNKLELRMQEIHKSQAERYIHGYSQREAQRLVDQATSVADFLHHDSKWNAGSRVLEIGCGVGAQTQIIAQQNPAVQFVSIDISPGSLATAQANIAALGLGNVTFQLKDVHAMTSKQDGVFDHLFICFLLEHLTNPLETLAQVKGLLRPGGTITVIEGDHGSTFFHPDNKYAQKLVHGQVELQHKRGGNANIGRALYPLLEKAGFKQIEVSPRQIYVDQSKPQLVAGFIKNTFTAMIQGISEDLIHEEIVSSTELEHGIAGLLRTAEPGGVFSYTFFKGKAVKL